MVAEEVECPFLREYKEIGFCSSWSKLSVILMNLKIDLLDEWLAKQGPKGKGFSRCTGEALSLNVGSFSPPINIY